MKNIRDLTPDDFPFPVDPVKLENWKNCRMDSDRAGWRPSPLFNFLDRQYKSSLSDDLARELGITEKILEEARDEIKLKNFPGCDPILFKKWRKVTIVRKTWSWLIVLLILVLWSVMYNSPDSRILIAVAFVLSISAFIALLMYPHLLRRKLMVKNSKLEIP